MPEESKTREFPLQSLRHFLVPDALLKVRSFEADSLSALDKQVNDWVKNSKAIIAVPSSPFRYAVNDRVIYTLTVSFLSCMDGEDVEFGG